MVLSYGEPWGSIFREREFGQDTSKPAPSVIAAPAAPAGMTTSNRVLPAVLPTEPKPRLGVDRRAGNYYKKETVPLDLESDDEEPDVSTLVLFQMTRFFFPFLFESNSLIPCLDITAITLHRSKRSAGLCPR